MCGVKKQTESALQESFDLSGTEHALRDVVAVPSVVKPFGQGKQVLEPLDGWYCPSGHFVHVWPPNSFWKRPAGQSKHLL